MTRPFAIHTVLRMVPNHLLKELLDQEGHREFDPKWNGLTRPTDIVQPLIAYMDELPKSKFDALECALHNVSDLASEEGLNALFEAAQFCGIDDLASSVPDDLCTWGRTMWVWLNHRSVFEKAQIIYQIDHMSWWRKRNDLPQNTPDVSSAATDRLAREISTLLRTQGRGRNCTVERIERGSIHYFFAYPDDFVQTVQIHNEESVLTVTPFRKTLQIVFAYNQEDGSLELYARSLPKKFKEQLERLFASVILHWGLSEFDPDAAYELNHLKDPSFVLRTDPADRVTVRIKRLGFSHDGTDRQIIVQVDEDKADDDIHKAIKECLNFSEHPLANWDVTLVTLCFEFQAIDGRKPGRQTIEVRYPRSCNLRNMRADRVEIIQKYLKRWKIDLAKQIESAVCAVGA